VKTINLKCARCGKQFPKELKEYNRQVKFGRALNHFFCSYGCAGFDRDEWSPFRYYISNARKNAKSKRYAFNLTIEYLKNLWDKQKGICPYLGTQMYLDEVGYDRHRAANSASLDRIDSCEGYIEGNVEWVCLFVNLGKNGFTKQQVKDLLGQWQSSNAPHSQ
jgi:endogenous inhibitor of DNA gyrase (YacG/DUF329 family)